MEKYMLASLIWVYDLQRRKLSVFIKNSTNDRVKNIMTNEICDIPRYHGDYGMEYRLDFNKILNTSDYIQYGFKEIYGMAGTKAFTTLSKEAKQVEKETKRYDKLGYDDCPYNSPDIDIYQYMSDNDIVSATQKAEPILQQNSEVKRREQDCQNRSSLQF